MTVHLLSRRKATSRGFTMLELIIVIVILGLLASLTLGVSASIVDRTHDAMARTTLNDSMRLANGLATLRDNDQYEESDFMATNDVQAAVVLAGGGEWSFTPGQSTQYGQVSFEISPDGRQAGVAMRSSSGRCGQGILYYGEAAAAAEIDAEMGGICSGRAAGERIEGWDELAGPFGAMPTTAINTAVAGTFTSERVGTFLIASAGTGAVFDTTVALVEGNLSVSSNNDAGIVQFVPATDYTGPYYFQIRLTDEAGNLSAVSQVTGDVSGPDEVPNDDGQPAGDCGLAPRPLAYSDTCAPTSNSAVVGGALIIAQRTTIYGDIRTVGQTTISNYTRFDATDGTFGYGNFIGGPVLVTNGSNVKIAGNVNINGDFRNDSPNTEIGGNLTTSSGSVIASKTLTVGGQVMVNTPGTISGPVNSAGNTVADGTVVAPASATVPYTDFTEITFDHTFATWAAFDIWYGANKSQLGRPGFQAVRITGTAAGALILAGGNVEGDFLLVGDTAMQIDSFPSAGIGSTITIMSTSTEVPAMTVTTNSPSTADTVLFAAGELRFTQPSTLRGQAIADTIRAAQRIDIVGRPATPWSTLILRHP